jgi:epoxide hydrolase-like predicted phosphatase
MARKDMRALVVDFGGVLTTDIWPAFASFCEGEGLEPDAVKQLFRGDSEALALLRGLETGALADAEFEAKFGGLLGVAQHEGLITRMFADLNPEPAMLDAVSGARAAGVKTGLISNSWGLGIYDRLESTDLFDVAVISGEVGLHKPQPEIYLLACNQLGVEPGEAVFVDDLRENCAGAEAVGMTALLHRDPAQTIAKLDELFGLELSTSLQGSGPQP